MIHIRNLTKRFNKRLLIDNVSLSLPDKGLVLLCGNSGSGKTTLLNMLAGIDNNFDGSITVNGIEIKKLSNMQLCLFRQNYISYIFQNNNLFNLDTVKNNVVIGLNDKENINNDYKKRLILETLTKVKIKDKIHCIVNKLSGGEKQRTAIARSIINNKPIILCDEPTGSLDNKNSRDLRSILINASKNALVIVASHDLNLFKDYCDFILNLNSGFHIINQNKNDFKKQSIQQKKSFDTKNKDLKLSLIIRHVFLKFRAKKYRSTISLLTISTSLTCFGLSIILNDGITSRFEQITHDLTGGNQISMTKRNSENSSINSVKSANLEEVKMITNNYDDKVKSLGSTYLVNFENFFKDKQDFFVRSNNKYSLLNTLTMGKLNYFNSLSKDLLTYPSYISNIKNDEVVLGLNFNQMSNICFDLQIERTFLSLGNYISTNNTFLNLELENLEWQYYDEQTFKIKAIIECDDTYLFHSNNFWNVEVLEEMMSIPSIDNMNKNFPWDLFKVNYFKTIDSSSILLNNFLKSSLSNKYILQKSNYDFNPINCKIDEVCNDNRIYVFSYDGSSIRTSEFYKILENNTCFKNYKFITDGGYASFSSSIISGFSKDCYLSKNSDFIDKIIDIKTSNSEDVLSLPDEALNGHFLSNSEGFNFSSDFSDLTQGRLPKEDDEICISTNMLQHFKISNPIGKTLYFAYAYKTIGQYQNFIKAKLKIVGVCSSDKKILYNNSDWTISFFRDFLNISSFELIPKEVIIRIDDNYDIDLIVEQLNKDYRDYYFTNPSKELSRNVSNTMSHISSTMSFFSFVCILISSLVMIILILISFLESKNDFKIFYYLGYSYNESFKIFYCYSIINHFIGAFISCFQLIVTEFLMCYIISSLMNTTLYISFTLNTYLYIFLISFLLSFLIPLFVLLITKQKKNKKVLY